MSAPVVKPLEQRILDYVAASPGETLEEIARGVRARSASVRDVLASAAFFASLRDAYPLDRAQVYRVASVGADGLGRAARRSQNDLIQEFLSDGEWHTTAQIHRQCGFSRLNSRIAELRRKRGMLIEHRFVDGATRGPEAHEYRFVGYQDGFGVPAGHVVALGEAA